MVSSLHFKEILLFSLVASSVSGKIHFKARQEEGGSIGTIPACVASAEATISGPLFETPGVLPTACPGTPGVATGTAGSTGAGYTGSAQPAPRVSVSLATAGVSSTSVSLPSAAISTTGSPQGPVSAAPLPSFITISAGPSGSSETFSQTLFPDLATLTTTKTVTTGIVQTDASGGTTTVQGPIVVRPGGIGFIGKTGALPTGVSIDGTGSTPGGSNNNNPGGNNNNNNNSDGDKNPSTQSTQHDSTSTRSTQHDSTASASSTEACILTEVACTQTCTVSSISSGSAPITSCGSPGLCRRQAGGGRCTSTTGTTTSTSFTTVSGSAFICRAGSCPDAVCGTSVPNIAPAITTNAPGDQIPSLANWPNLASKKSRRRITRLNRNIERAVDPAVLEGQTSIRQIVLTDPDSLFPVGAKGESSKVQWYKNAQDLVKKFGPDEGIFAVGADAQDGFPSSTKFNYDDLLQNAIVTGSGPSWGCTSVLVYSERGVWIAHFWELEQMQAPDFNDQVLKFIRSGDPGHFEGLSDVVPSLFSGPSPGKEEGEIVEVPVFAGAIIFTPSFRSFDVLPPGSQPTDPIYSDKVNQIKSVLVNQIPGFTLANMNDKIKVQTYAPVEDPTLLKSNPWRGLLTFEYVPYFLSNDNNVCKVLRAVRIHIQDVILPAMTWNWPDPAANPNSAGPSKSKNKRQGACPVNLSQILSAQGGGTAGPASFFDISTPVSGVTGVTSRVGPTSASGSASTTASASPSLSQSPSQTSRAASLAATKSSRPAAATTSLATTKSSRPAAAATSTSVAGPVWVSLPPCSIWDFGDGVDVGSDCDGDPKKTITVTVPPGKRAVKTAF